MRSSNTGTQNRMQADALERVDADHPDHRMASDGFDTGRARLLIRGSTAGPPGERLGPLWDHTLCIRPHNPHVGAPNAGPSRPTGQSNG